MSKFWNDVKRQYSQGRDELMRAMYPDWPSGFSGHQPDRDASRDAAASKDRNSPLDSRLDIAASRDDSGREDRGLDRE